MTLLEVLLGSSVVILALSLIAVGYRMVKGPSVPDRIVALDLFLFVVVALACVGLIASRDRTLLDMAFVAALAAFVGTVSAARYVERSGAKR